MNQQMNTILFSAICACFGLQSSSAAAAVLIREAYAEPENAPRPPRNTDVISITDCKVELGHPDVGRAHIHQCGHGKITISSAGDLTSHTMTADGYVVVNTVCEL